MIKKLINRLISKVRDKIADAEEAKLWAEINKQEEAYERRLAAEIEDWRARLKKAGIHYNA